MEFAISSVPEPSFSATPTLPVSHLTPSYVSELNLAVVPSFKVSNVYAQTLFPKTVDLKTTSFATCFKYFVSAIGCRSRRNKFEVVGSRYGAWLAVVYIRIVQRKRVVERCCGRVVCRRVCIRVCGQEACREHCESRECGIFLLSFHNYISLAKTKLFQFLYSPYCPSPSPKSRQK